MNSDQNGARNAFQNATGTDSERSYAGARACEPLLSSEELPTPSRSVAPARESDEAITERIRSIPFADALTAVVCRLRPEWSPVEVRRWALTDPRGESAVITAGITGAASRAARFPAGLAKVGPELDLGTVELPPTLAEYRNAPRCRHGAEVGRCFPCRAHRRTEEPA